MVPLELVTQAWKPTNLRMLWQVDPFGKPVDKKWHDANPTYLETFFTSKLNHVSSILPEPLKSSWPGQTWDHLGFL